VALERYLAEAWVNLRPYRVYVRAATNNLLQDIHCLTQTCPEEIGTNQSYATAFELQSHFREEMATRNLKP